jgi:tRNA pseudouridine38-40 synthase
MVGRQIVLKNLKVILAYNGSAYVGWQRQPNGISVQQKLEEALSQLSGSKVTVEGASRTDTGVHALGMVVSFRWTPERPSWKELTRSLNALLPEDIRVLKISRVSEKFHARFEAKTKLYRYRILNSPIGDPFRLGTAWYIPKPLNVSEMKRAANCFVGKHDFSSVAVNPGYERETMVRTIRRCDVAKSKDEIHIEVEGDGFLYKMVRTMVGTLVEVGLGKRDSHSIKSLIKSRDRTKAGKTAPAHGLYLVKVKY